MQASDGASLADQAQQTAKQQAEQVQQKAQDVAGTVRSQAREQIEQRSSQAAGQLRSQADDLRTISFSLRDQGKDGPAQVADRLAGYAERIGGYLEGRSGDQLLHDAEDLGRRQPWAVTAAGLALGFAASRFLKASSRERYAASRSGGSSVDRGAYAPGGSPLAGAPRTGSYPSGGGYSMGGGLSGDGRPGAGYSMGGGLSADEAAVSLRGSAPPASGAAPVPPPGGGIPVVPGDQA